jgi:hypothetical protein
VPERVPNSHIFQKRIAEGAGDREAASANAWRGALLYGMAYPFITSARRAGVRGRAAMRVRCVALDRGAVVSEWQRDWGWLATLPALSAVVAEHGGGSSITALWESQLLASGAGVKT